MALEVFNKMENMKDLIEQINSLYPEEYKNFLEYCNIDVANDTLVIKFQTGPRKEVGTNGIQIDILILIAQSIIRGLNKEFPCEENELAISGLSLAISALNKRTTNRVNKSIEGYNK